MKKNKKISGKCAKSCLAVAAALPLIFASCQKDNALTGNNSRRAKNTTDTLEALMQDYDAPQEYATQDESFLAEDVFGLDDTFLAPREDIASDVDIDLTKVSSTFVYAEVFNMMMDPEYYVGKTVRMAGDFSVYRPVLPNGTVSEDNFYACVIADATACCQQGLTFDVGQKYKFPNDFPKEGSQITVTGTFAIQDQGDFAYFYVKDAKIM